MPAVIVNAILTVTQKDGAIMPTTTAASPKMVGHHPIRSLSVMDIRPLPFTIPWGRSS